MSFCATIQEPPTATTDGNERYSFAFAADIPPVGMKLMPGNGADIALSAATPPRVSAGKNLRVDIPALIACNISVGVDTPGKYGIPCFSASTATVGENPAETANRAPTSIAFFKSSPVRNDPTPTSKSLLLAAIFNASKLAGVRKVISAIGKPPATSAEAKSAALEASLIATTGTILKLLINSIRV